MPATVAKRFQRLRNHPLTAIIAPALTVAVAVVALGQTSGQLRMVNPKGGRLDWLSTSPFLVAYDAVGPSGAHEVFTMKPDGSGSRCVTCQAPDLPRGLSRGNPAWHPSGKFIVFQATRPNDLAGERGNFITDPGQGIANDLWLTEPSGRRYWKLASTNPRGGGLLHAHFSPDGLKLLWAERLGHGPTRYGLWALQVADFDPSGPRISNVRSFQPLGAGAYESHGFTPDSKRIVFCASPPPASFGNTNIYTLDLATSKLVNLTNMSHEWNEHGHFSHSGKQIIWSSSLGNNVVRDPSGNVKGTGKNLDLWMMDSDGTHRHRLTNINQPGSPAYDPGFGAASDGDWGPDDRQYMFYVIRPRLRPDRTSPVTGQIWVLDVQ